jgi:hypothetical protein
VSAALLIRLKITDLTAWSALETGRRLLPAGHALDRLVREQVLLFEALPGSPADAYEPALREATRHSNFFVNPNKESDRFLGHVEREEPWRPPDGAWGILARAREDTRDGSLLERLQREHPLQGLAAIRRAKVWWLWTRDPRGGAGIEVLSGVLGELHDQRHGLLVNPHSELAMVLDGPIAWSRIDRFLVEPSSAYHVAA